MCYIAAIAIHHFTIVEWWLPLAISVSLAALCAAFARRLWPCITRTRSASVNFLVHILATTGIFLASIYCVNLLPSPSEEMEVEIVDKYTRLHHRNRRVGRHYLPTGEKYRTYHIIIALPDGSSKTVSLPAGRYNRIHTGKTVSIPVRAGFLGMPVLPTGSAF